MLNEVLNNVETPRAEPPAGPITKVVDSRDLFANQNTVLIRHHDVFYRLLKTKNGKLILQK